MIIDSHVHLIGEDWVKPGFSNGFVQLVTIAFSGTREGTHPEDSPTDLQLSYDTTGERLIADMDAAGVDKSCIFALDFGLATGDAEVSIQEQNRKVAEAAARFPDRLVPFFTVDPRRPEGLAMFERAVEDWGMRGLKLHPASGYYPNDPAVYPYYNKCRQYAIPVLIHSGAAMGIADSPLTHPRHFDQVAADYHDVAIILAHLGYPHWKEALALAKARSNVYFDISGGQLPVSKSPKDFYQMLRIVLDEIGPWRVFFGSDGPYYNGVFPLSQWVRELANPDPMSCGDIFFTREEMDAVMGQAFANLLKVM
jgi:predicted TIM-barrel fold metal-dependent hydrolase